MNDADILARLKAFRETIIFGTRTPSPIFIRGLLSEAIAEIEALRTTPKPADPNVEV